MKLAFNILVCALLAAFALATTEQKPVIVSYPEDTPQSVIEKAMDAIKEAGGIITHEYTIITGFAAKASEQALDIVQALGEKHDIIIEADQVVSINDDKS